MLTLENFLARNGVQLLCSPWSLTRGEGHVQSLGLGESH